jgi:hypothetical protein
MRLRGCGLGGLRSKVKLGCWDGRVMIRSGGNTRGCLMFCVCIIPWSVDFGVVALVLGCWIGPTWDGVWACEKWI